MMHDLYTNSLLVTFLNEPELICLLLVKWFQVLLLYFDLRPGPKCHSR